MANNRKGQGPQPRRRGTSAQQGAQAALDRAERAADQADELLTGGVEPELGGREHLDSIVRTIARRVGADQADELLTGGVEPELGGREHLDSIVRTIARRVGATQARLTGGNTLETMARLKQDSLLGTPIVDGSTGHQTSVQDGGKTLMDALAQVEASAINDLFATEKGRLDDYQTYAQIADLITQAAEAVQTYADNIVSPDDFTKRDINVYYDGADDDGELLKEVRARCGELIEKYRIEDRGEEAILKSLVKGDFFVAILNLRQELEGVLNEAGELAKPTALIEAAHVPNLEDADMKALIEAVQAEAKEGETVDTSNLRHELATYLNDLVVVHEDTSVMAAKSAMSMALAQDLPTKGRRKPAKRDGGEGEGASLAGSKIRGSVVKMIPPENVIKLYQDDTLFGYYFIELSGPDIADFARRGTMDQTAVVRAIDQNHDPDA
jgi:hypothetical protein